MYKLCYKQTPKKCEKNDVCIDILYRLFVISCFAFLLVWMIWHQVRVGNYSAGSRVLQFFDFFPVYEKGRSNKLYGNHLFVSQCCHVKRGGSYVLYTPHTMT